MLHPDSHPGDQAQRAATVVVIDVLRMTSTASVLMGRPSCEGVAVAATLGDVERLPIPLSDCVIVSELAGAAGLGAGRWIDNSPAKAGRFEFGARTPVLVTTNGTKTLFAAAARGERVLLASFRDLRAVARHLAEGVAEPDAVRSSVLVMPAGHIDSGESRVEDDLCAEALTSLLAGREPDLEACAAAIRTDPRVVRRIENEPGFSADVDLALEGDPLACVLEFRPLEGGVGHIRRASASPAPSFVARGAESHTDRSRRI